MEVQDDGAEDLFKLLPGDIILDGLFNYLPALDRLLFAQTNKRLLALLDTWRQSEMTPLMLRIKSFPSAWTLRAARIIYRIDFGHINMDNTTKVYFYGNETRNWVPYTNYKYLAEKERIPGIPDATTFYRLAREKAYRYILSNVDEKDRPKTLTPDSIYVFGGTVQCHETAYFVGFSFECNIGKFFYYCSFYDYDTRSYYPYKAIAQYFSS